MSTESMNALLGEERVKHIRRLQVETEALAKYIADYVMEEQSRGNIEVHKYMIMDAIASYKRGAR